MRFTAAQLRLLQDDLMTPLPPLVAPPELSTPGPHQAAPQQAAPPGSTAVPGFFLGYLYLSSICFWLMASYLAPDLLVLGSAPAHATLLLHCLACPSSRAAQCLGLACALALPPVCAASRQDLFAVLAVGCSAFFVLASPHAGPLRPLTAACCVLVAVLAVAVLLLAPASLPRHSRRQAWGAVTVLVGVQAVASTARLRAFEVVCALRAL